MNSSDAPPPVETWVMSASTPARWMAATESPPPDDRGRGAVRDGPGDCEGAVGEGGDLEHAHRAVPQHGAGGGDGRAVAVDGLGTDVDAEPVSDGGVRDAEGGVGGIRVEPVGDDVVARQLESHPVGACGPFEVEGGVEERFFHQRSAHRAPAGLEEGVGHGAADEQGVEAGKQVADDLELARDLGAAEDADERPWRRLEERAEMLQLLRHQQTGGGVRHVAHHADGRGVGPVRGAEGVVGVGVARRRQRGRERGVVGLFAGVEAEVLEQHHAAATGLGERGGHRLADRVGREDDRAAEQFRQARRYRPQRERWIRGPLRPAQMGADDEGRPPVEGEPQGREGGANPGVVADDAVAHGNVEVDAHEQPVPVEIEVVEGSLAHGCLMPPSKGAGPRFFPRGYWSVTS